jgi:hypothetical protein
MIEILPPLGKYKYDTWRILPVKYYIDNSVRLRSRIRNVNTWHHNIFPFVAQLRRKVQNCQHNWPRSMCATVHEWVHAISAHWNPNIPQINGKYRILWINISPLCGISRLSYHSSILLMLLFVPSQQFWLLICKPMLQTRNDMKVQKHLFRTFSSVSVAVLITNAIFSTIELVESTNRAFLKVFILRPTI